MDKVKLQELYASIMEKPERDRKAALAELLIEYVQPNHVTADLVNLIIGTRALKPGDALVKKVRKGIEVRTLVPGAVHLASEVTVRERINYVLDGADVKVTYNDWDIENGDIGTVQDLRREMDAKLRDFYLNKVFSALTTVWTASNTPSNFISLGSAVTSTALENAINRINATTPGVKVIVGTRAAMTPITKFAAYWPAGSTTLASQTRIDEILGTGNIGTYLGARLLTLDQVYDNPEDYNKLLPEDKILVVGENVGEFITFGEVKFKQWTDMNPTPPQWFMELYQQFGMIIDNAQGLYVIGGIV